MTNKYLLPSPNEISKRKTILFLLAVFVFLYLKTFLLPNTPLAPQNDAVFFFEHAKRILLGQVPFRDYFAFVMPGTDLLYAGIFYLFGVHAWVTGAIAIVLGVTLAAIILKISEKVLRGSTVFLPTLLFLIFDFDNALDATHHWYSTLLVLAAAAVLLPGKTDRRILFAGAMCGLATVFTQSKGLAGFLAIAMFLLLINYVEKQSNIRLMRQLALLVMPFVAILGGVLGYYAHEAGIHALVYALWEYAFLFTATQYTYPLLQAPIMHSSPQEVFHSVSQISLFLFVPLVYLFSTVRLIRQRHRMDRQIWEAVFLVNLVGITLLATLASGPTYHRLCTVAPAAFIAFVWLLGGGRHTNVMVRALWAVSVALVVAIPVRLQLKPRQYLDLPIGRSAFLSSEQYSRQKWLAAATRPGDPFLGLTIESFTLGLRNPTPVDLVSRTSMTPPALEDTVVSSLREHPAVVIFLPKDEPWDHKDGLPRFLSFVHSHYHLAKQFPSGQFWVVN